MSWCMDSDSFRAGISTEILGCWALGNFFLKSRTFLVVLRNRPREIKATKNEKSIMRFFANAQRLSRAHPLWVIPKVLRRDLSKRWRGEWIRPRLSRVKLISRASYLPKPFAKLLIQWMLEMFQKETNPNNLWVECQEYQEAMARLYAKSNTVLKSFVGRDRSPIRLIAILRLLILGWGSF